MDESRRTPEHDDCEHSVYSDIEPTLACGSCGNRVPFHYPCCTRDQPLDASDE